VLANSVLWLSVGIWAKLRSKSSGGIERNKNQKMKGIQESSDKPATQ